MAFSNEQISVFDAPTVNTGGSNPTARAPITAAAQPAPIAVPPTLGSVVGNSTVQGQMTGLLSQNSAYMQQAKADSLKGMNARGLQNSSMAIGAGQSAAIRSAMPIAQQDAQIYNNQAMANQAATNKFEANSQNYNINNALQQQQIDAKTASDANSFDYRSALTQQGIDAQTASMAQKFGYDTQMSDQSAGNQQALSTLQSALQSQLNASSALSAQDRDRLAAQLDLVQSQVKHQQDIEKAYLQSMANIRQTSSSDAALIGRTEGLSTEQQQAAMNTVYDRAGVDTSFMQSVFGQPQSWNW